MCHNFVDFNKLTFKKFKFYSSLLLKDVLRKHILYTLHTRRRIKNIF